MNAEAEKLLIESISESISGIMSLHRARGRVAKLTSVRVKIPLKEIQQAVKNHFDTLRIFDDLVIPRLPSVASLRDKWLPKIIASWTDVTIADDALELTVEIPPARKAHAR